MMDDIDEDNREEVTLSLLVESYSPSHHSASVGGFYFCLPELAPGRPRIQIRPYCVFSIVYCLLCLVCLSCAGQNLVSTEPILMLLCN